MPTETRGHEGIVAYLEQIREVYSESAYFPHEVVDPGGATLIARTETAAIGAASGFATNEDQWYVWRLRDGKVCRQDVFEELAPAIAEAQIAVNQRGRRGPPRTPRRSAG